MAKQAFDQSVALSSNYIDDIKQITDANRQKKSEEEIWNGPTSPFLLSRTRE